MKVLLRNPRREVEVDGPMTVHALLQRLALSPESVLVIVGDELVTHDAKLDDSAAVEIRPVISGGDAAVPLAGGRDGAAESTIRGGGA
ncbi:MAG TPA: MoaD/ThiS family protein [Acidimicrobiia bacterium]